jgi:hypothetical protein
MRGKRSPSGSKMPAADISTFLTRGAHNALALAALGWCLLAVLTCTTFLGFGAPRRSAAVDDVGNSSAGQFSPLATDASTQRGMQLWSNPASSSGSESRSAVPTLDGRDSATTLSRDKGGDAATNTQAVNGPVVRIHHRQGSLAGKDAAMRIAQEVRKAGGGIVSINAEPTVPAIRQLRYSSHADAAEASELVHRFKRRWGNAWRVNRIEDAAGDRQFEIWLPHR